MFLEFIKKKRASMFFQWSINCKGETRYDKFYRKGPYVRVPTPHLRLFSTELVVAKNQLSLLIKYVVGMSSKEVVENYNAMRKKFLEIKAYIQPTSARKQGNDRRYFNLCDSSALSCIGTKNTWKNIAFSMIF